MKTESTKFIQRGSGQLFYLQHMNAGPWILERFTGGPGGMEIVGGFNDEVGALRRLGELGCTPFDAMKVEE